VTRVLVGLLFRLKTSPCEIIVTANNKMVMCKSPAYDYLCLIISKELDINFDKITLVTPYAIIYYFMKLHVGLCIQVWSLIYLTWRSRYSDCLRDGGSSRERINNFHFSISSRPALRSTQPPIQWVPGVFPGSKAAGE
jgi:hypothetical protein